jgi:DNA-binding transcriptional LysR family regulator
VLLGGHNNEADGIGLLPPHYCNEQLDAGAFVRVLPDWSSSVVAEHAVYPTRKFLPERVHVFLQELKNWQGPFWSKA